MPDLMQAASIGLLHAMRKFDLSRGHKFLTYAGWWIKRYVQMEYAKSNLIVFDRCKVKLSETKEDKQRAVRMAFMGSARDYGEEHWEPEQPVDIRSFDAEDVELLMESISHLRERDRFFVRMRYFDNATYEEIGTALGLTRSRVGQLVHAISRRLFFEFKRCQRMRMKAAERKLA